MSMTGNPNPHYKPLDNGWGVQPIGPTPLGGDYHDTFRVDRYGNLSGGHTTFRVPGGQEKRLSW